LRLGVRGIAVHEVTKNYGHVEALRGVNLAVAPSEIVALFGDNGAGKSTLAKIMSGASHPTTGEIQVDGETVEFHSVRDAQSKGVEMVYQDLSLASDLTVAENIFLGRELPAKRPLARIGMLDRRAMDEQSMAVLDRLAIRGVLPRALVSDLSGGQRQAVAIARALTRAKTALLLDEPTAALGPHQSDLVCNAIRAVAATGIALLVVSHDLERMRKLASRITVLHRGRIVLDVPPANVKVESIVAAMMGGIGHKDDDE
jgi:simple sugar transport system ATP-binding protein